jgi:PAS domain S-box-containing protein
MPWLAGQQVKVTGPSILRVASISTAVAASIASVPLFFLLRNQAGLGPFTTGLAIGIACCIASAWWAGKKDELAAFLLHAGIIVGSFVVITSIPALAGAVLLAIGWTSWIVLHYTKGKLRWFGIVLAAVGVSILSYQSIHGVNPFGMGKATVFAVIGALTAWATSLVVMLELTKERHWATEQAARIGNQANVVLESLGEAIVVADPEGTIIRTNEAANRMFGRTIVGLRVRDIIHPGDIPGHLDRLASAKAGTASRYTKKSYVLRIKRGDDIVHVESRLTYLPGPPGRWVACLRDLSERLKLEDAEHQRVVAEAANQAKTEFLASMSHDMRTPLHAIMGFSEVLADSNLTKEQANIVKTIQASSRHLLALVTDVLDLSKIESGHIRIDAHPANLATVCEDAVSMVRPSANAKGIELGCDLSLPHEFYLVDQGRLLQVLLNLLGNAVKFTDAGSVRLVVQQTEAGIELKVRDTGPGLPPGLDVFAMFAPGEAGASPTRGTGLGLAITKRIITAMEGTIDFATSPQGTTFTISLPLQQAEPPVQIVKTEPTPSATALVVEDNAINQKVADGLLRMLGAAPTLVASGNEALQAIEEQAFDVIFMDIQMPEMDGYETTRRILQRRPDAYIVGMTAHAGLADRRRCLASGMKDYLSKPVLKEQMADALRRVHWAQTAQR